jgi:GNAT superfamily N-acetyltransferase
MTARPSTSRAAEPAALAELVEAEAWAQMQLARSTESRAQLGITAHRHDGATTIATRDCPELSVNRVFALGVETPATPNLLEKIIREYRDAGVERFIMQLSPIARPVELRDWLAERGCQQRGTLVKLVRTTDDASALSTRNDRNDRGDIRVVEISGAERDTFIEIVGAPLQVPPAMRLELCATMGTPGWRFYLAYMDARPIAGAAMYVGEDAAWCGLAATMQAERGRGAQSALFVRRIQDAAAAGCRWVTAETLPERPDRPNPSLRNMRRLGFEELYERQAHVHGLPAVAAT